MDTPETKKESLELSFLVSGVGKLPLYIVGQVAKSARQLHHENAQKKRHQKQVAFFSFKCPR